MVTLNCKSISQTQPSDWVTTNNICNVQCDNHYDRYDLKFQEHTIISVRHSLEIFPREFSNSTGDGGGPKRYRVNANPWRLMRILGSLGYQIPVTPAGLRDDYDTFHG